MEERGRKEKGGLETNKYWLLDILRHTNEFSSKEGPKFYMVQQGSVAIVTTHKVALCPGIK